MVFQNWQSQTGESGIKKGAGLNGFVRKSKFQFFPELIDRI